MEEYYRIQVQQLKAKLTVSLIQLENMALARARYEQDSIYWRAKYEELLLEHEKLKSAYELQENILLQVQRQNLLISGNNNNVGQQQNGRAFNPPVTPGSPLGAAGPAPISPQGSPFRGVGLPATPPGSPFGRFGVPGSPVFSPIATRLRSRHQ